ncbi:hypothetical protein NESM_000730100 [Novymonas esmeraldas]|uniref:Uncharacterized protein n=1 Tax=Novymonas esmeraldas TaxID=1808958 RepID=A0AAW0EXH6_9TRYP
METPPTVKTEAEEEETGGGRGDDAPVAEQRHASPAAASAASDDDVGPIDIEELDGDEPPPLSTYDANMLVGAASVLTAAEEVPPSLSAPYMDALLRTDPRLSFDALHIGVLRAIEAAEGLRRSEHDYPSWSVPPVVFVARPSSGAGPHFTAPSLHRRLRARPPLDRGDREVDELLAEPTRRALCSVIGDDLLDHLRFHRTVESVRRRRAKRSTPEGGK